MANYLRTRALIGQEDLSYGIAGSTFSRPNSTGGSQTLHSMGSLSQKIAVATDCAGVDIGAQINCAVTALEPTGGTIYIPAGSYSFATTIVIPRNILLVGLGSNNTALTYTGSGTAIILGDNTPGPLYTRGGLRDFMLIGNGSTVNSIAVYIGGDPAGVVCPSNNYADHMTIRNCRIGGTGTSATGFGVGLQF